MQAQEITLFYGKSYLERVLHQLCKHSWVTVMQMEMLCKFCDPDVVHLIFLVLYMCAHNWCCGMTGAVA